MTHEIYSISLFIEEMQTKATKRDLWLHINQTRINDYKKLENK